MAPFRTILSLFMTWMFEMHLVKGLTSTPKLRIQPRLRYPGSSKFRFSPLNSVEKDREEDGQSEEWLSSTTVAMALSGALLGPNLDNFHSAFGVLQYASPIILRSPFDGSVLLTTAAFTPPLFGLAAIIIGGLYVFIDEKLGLPLETKLPSLALVVAGIFYFCLQYWFSGLLCSLCCSLLQLHVALAATMVMAFLLFDRSVTGVIVGVATGIGGPLIELFLINQLHLYSYTQADFFGIDSWIPWVYGAGAPAVGNLARAFKSYFSTLRE